MVAGISVNGVLRRAADRLRTASSQGPEATLAAAVLRQALLDAKAGSPAACAWFRRGDGALPLLCEALDVDPDEFRERVLEMLDIE